MTDLALFIFGCVVTSIVASAVLLLLFGARATEEASVNAEPEHDLEITDVSRKPP